MNPALLAALPKLVGAAGDWMDLTAKSSLLEGNADLNDLEAQQVIANGDFEARRLEARGEKFTATQRAMYAASGVKFEGSPMEVYADTEKNIRLDVLTTKLNAAGRANEIGFQALQQRIAAGQARTRRLQALSNTLLSVGGDLAVGQLAKSGSKDPNLADQVGGFGGGVKRSKGSSQSQINSSGWTLK